MVKIIRISEETHKAIKVRAALAGKTVSEMAEQILKGEEK